MCEHELNPVHKAIAEQQALVYMMEGLVKKANEQLERTLALCDDPECPTCGMIVCPHGEALHYHHDGCPFCSAEPGDKL